jgi:uncharacterized lipoprotein YehR (DUF1307 family)
MKKILSILFAMFLTIAFTACGDSTEANKTTEKATTPSTSTTKTCVPAPGEICPA